MYQTDVKRHVVQNLYSQNSDMVLRFFTKRTKTYDDAQELTQETFLKILEKGFIEKIPAKKTKKLFTKMRSK